jgi:RNA polymerase sigma-70 factor (ECF subfamily)
VADPENAHQFTALYADHHRRVYAYAVARAGRSLADEVVAETFLVAWRRFAQMPAAAALPWLLGVARNVIRERYRDEERQRALAAEMLAWTADTPDVADGVAERSAVLAALAGLSEKDREVLTLTAWDGLAPRDAARVVNCSAPAFLVRLHRARRRLARAVEAAGEPVTEPEPVRATGRPEPEPYPVRDTGETVTEPRAAGSAARPAGSRTPKPTTTAPDATSPAVTREPSR